MEGLGCNWKENLTSREEILVLMNSTYLDSPQPLWFTPANCSRTGGKRFFFVMPWEGMVLCKEGVHLQGCSELWALAQLLPHPTICYIKWLQLSLYILISETLWGTQSGWQKQDGDKLNLLLWTRSKGPENFHVKQGWTVKYKYPHD